MSTAALYAVGNVVTSVAIVLVNKRAFAGGFKFPMTLTFLHFCFTIVWYKMLQYAAVYTPCAPDAMPTWERFKVAGAVFSSIGFMNLSLNANSIGFYQVTKLVIIPAGLVINAAMYGVHTTGKIMVSLAILLAGVGVATVTEVHLRPLGMVYGIIAILTTAICQIWQGSKQKEFGISATQLQAALAPWMSAQVRPQRRPAPTRPAPLPSPRAQSYRRRLVCPSAPITCLAHHHSPPHASPFAFLAPLTSPPSPRRSQALSVALATEILGPEGSYSFLIAAINGDALKAYTMWLVLATCFIALLVNLSSFGLIGKTSAVTFQVVGHAKTCLVLAGGYLFFPAHGKHNQEQLYHNIMGVSVAMVGVVLYGHLQHASGKQQPDCFDAVCPGCILAVISPESSDKEERDRLATSNA